MKRLLDSCIAGLLAFSAIGGAHIGLAEPKAETFKSGTFEPARMAPDFELQSSSGSPFKLSRYRGKVVALAFGFTHCTRICPTTLSTLAQVARSLGDEAGRLQVVFVTVDPERDSVARLHDFVGLFDSTFLGVTGTDAQLHAVRQAYGVTIERETSEDERLGYQVHHSSSIFLIDRDGKLRLFVPFGKTAEHIAHDIKLLLQ